MPTVCGTVALGSWPGHTISEDTALEVKFGLAFDMPPRVVVQLAAIDADSPRSKRIDSFADDVTCHGFRLHTRTWADSVTWSVKVSWIATSDHLDVQLGSCVVGGAHNVRVGASEEQKVIFPRPCACTPDLVVALAMIDAGGPQLKIWSGGQGVTSKGFALLCGSHEPCQTWSTKVSWVSSLSYAALQLGSEDIILEEEERTTFVNVRFSRAFDLPPSVALALGSIDADCASPIRIDTFADTISEEGFRLHLKTWANSTTRRVRVAWYAAPGAASVTLSELPKHQPPSEYIVEGPPIGQGWWGVTHRAKSTVDGGIYAVKTCKHSFVRHEKVLRQELENLSRLPMHQNLLRYYGSILQVDRLHIITEFLDARKLVEMVPVPDGPFPKRHRPASILRWTGQLLDGLAHMHQAGMVHRDLHGENILVERDIDGMPSEGPRAIRIIDFGMAKVYDVIRPQAMSNLFGCMQYFSPERRKGGEFDDRDDVWAAGCHLVELTTGRTLAKRPDCGPCGVDFATSPKQIAEALRDCGNGSRCRQLAEAILVSDPGRRPTAAVARDVSFGMVNFAPGKRLGSSGGGHRSRPSSTSRCS
mmetsp:Transcript_13502/g.29635  ORF Transcript_13502/g.29635 Transcript_13502/m.29635 type:complete len:589 (-) Transcript_13502:140-1906(-)